MMLKGIFLISVLFSIAFGFAQGQEQGRLRAMFWNVENLFYPEDDSLTEDDDFTPEGNMHWTFNRYHQKLNRIFKVFAAAGIYEPPALIALAEIEDMKVLQDLYYRTPLNKYDYGIVHRDSPDRRGIDVALFYRKGLFQLLGTSFIRLRFIEEPDYRTRDILHAKLLLQSEDTLHAFVNHWPSRYGGVAAFSGRRAVAAGNLSFVADSILQKNPSASILILGDFNDEPGDASISEILGAGPAEAADSFQWINLAEGTGGTIKYKGDWQVFDQVIVSRPLYLGQAGLKAENYGILQLPELLTEDTGYTGAIPYRTYRGWKYDGGYSDHLPVVVDIVY